MVKIRVEQKFFSEYNICEMYDKLFNALAKSTFRSRFKLKDKDKEYIAQKGLDTIKSHAKDFIAKAKTANTIKIETQFYQEGNRVFTFTADEPLKWEH